MTSLYEAYNSFLNSADFRTADWPLVGSPLPISIIIVSYLYFVKKCGPDYMRHRKPYDLKLTITLYNIAQVLSCIYIFYELLASGWWNDYSMGCQHKDMTVNAKNMRMATAVWWTMILKMSELIETVFFVLRKKSNQVTTLHLYHHVSTLIVGWLAVKYTPGGMATFAILPNSLVHVLMYSYYLVSLHASKALQQKLSRWKKYLTIIQMLQFCVILAHAFQGLVPSCEINKVVLYTFIPNVFLVFYLFYDFYKKSYNKSKSK